MDGYTLRELLPNADCIGMECLKRQGSPLRSAYSKDNSSRLHHGRSRKEFQGQIVENVNFYE